MVKTKNFDELHTGDLLRIWITIDGREMLAKIIEKKADCITFTHNLHPQPYTWSRTYLDGMILRGDVMHENQETFPQSRQENSFKYLDI